MQLYSSAKMIANHYGFEVQAMQAIEECAELIQALNKRLRPDSFTKEIIESNLIEEIADVQIMLCQLKILLDCDEAVSKVMHKKLERQLERIRIANEQSNSNRAAVWRP